MAWCDDVRAGWEASTMFLRADGTIRCDYHDHLSTAPLATWAVSIEPMPALAPSHACDADVEECLADHTELALALCQPQIRVKLASVPVPSSAQATFYQAMPIYPWRVA